jgi:predicted outer membrane repeat protein
MVVVLCPLVAGKTIRVANDGSADYRTIQAAIDASVQGDTVLVASGTYAGEGNRDIDFQGKAITLKSESGAPSCVIKCGGRRPLYVIGRPPVAPEYHRGFYFHSHEDANSIIEGFTITQGYMGPYNGGAIYCEDSSPTVQDCIITGNMASSGGGIAAFGSNILLENCIIKENTASWTEHDRGGGMALYNGNARVRNCLFAGNVATQQGGGLYCARGNYEVVNCTVSGNRVGRWGVGGGVCFGPDADNTSHVRNSIVWGNCGGYLGGDDVALPDNGILWVMGLTIEYSMMGDDPNALHDPHKRVTGSWIASDPKFAAPGHWDPNGTPDYPNDDLWVEGDYHLKSPGGRWDPDSQNWVIDDVTSPCIDAGDPMSPIGLEPFPNGGRINIGAYGGTAEASKSISGLSGKYGGGSGAAGNPYLIFTAEQFDAIGDEPVDWDKHFRLIADIDLSGYPGHELHLLGVDESSPFSGVFDGDGHKISGLGRHSTKEYTSGALFGYLTGTVKGVGLIDPNVGGRLLYYTGTLVGDNHGTVSNCYAHDVNVVGAGWYAGGLVGRNIGTIADCNSTGVVRDRSAGGLVGRNGGTITGCRSAAVVSADTIAGGLVGSNVSGTIANSCSTGTVTGDDRTGGLVGNNYEGTITCCHSSAEVVGNDGVGGLVGENWQGLVANCYSAANVKGDRLTGGLVGDSGGGAITNCYAMGPVIGRWPAGGVVSWRHDDDIVTGCFWDMETTGCEWSAAGTGKTTAQMQTAATFLSAGWDFLGETTNGTEDVWRISQEPGYPRLFWEAGSK